MHANQATMHAMHTTKDLTTLERQMRHAHEHNVAFSHSGWLNARYGGCGPRVLLPTWPPRSGLSGPRAPSLGSPPMLSSLQCALRRA